MAPAVATKRPLEQEVHKLKGELATAEGNEGTLKGEVAEAKGSAHLQLEELEEELAAE